MKNKIELYKPNFGFSNLKHYNTNLQDIISYWITDGCNYYDYDVQNILIIIKYEK